MSMTVGGSAAEAANNHVRAKRSDDSHHIRQHGVAPAPLVEGFLRSLGETKVGSVREALVDSVVTVSGEEFEGAERAQCVEEAVAHAVLAALATSDGKQDGIDAMAARFQRQHTAIFVIGMRGGVQHARRGAQLSELLNEAGSTFVLRQRLGIRYGLGGVRGGRSLNDRRLRERNTNAEKRKQYNQTSSSVQEAPPLMRQLLLCSRSAAAVQPLPQKWKAGGFIIQMSLAGC